MERKLLLNRWQTPDGTVLTSYYTHDYVQHTDKNGDDYFVDGGNEYIRISDNKEKMKDMCVYTDSPFAEIRTSIRRGTFDKDGHRIWIPICRMNSPHLENSITYVMNRFGNSSPHIFIYIKELVTRWEANMYVPECVYTEEDAADCDESVPMAVRTCPDTLNCTIDEALDAFETNIKAGLHADNEAVVMLLKHALNLYEWRDKLKKNKENIRKI